MRKALKRSGLLLIATGVLALAYHVGNLNSPSIPYEPTPYEAADLAAPTPIAPESSIAEPAQPASCPPETRRSRIISVTPARELNQSRSNARDRAPLMINGHPEWREPARVEVVGVQSLPERLPGAFPAKALQAALPSRNLMIESSGQATAPSASSGRSEGESGGAERQTASEDPKSPPEARPSAHEPNVKRRPIEDEDVAWHVIETPRLSFPKRLRRVYCLRQRRMQKMFLHPLNR